MESDTRRRVVAEFFGTFWLVFGGCGAAVLAAAFPDLGIGFLGVAFAFGLTVLTMAYAVGHVSGGHFNPAVTIGLWAAGRCANRHVIPYIVAQVIAAIAAAAVLWLIASSQAGWVPGGFASNGYGDLSPGKYRLGGCFLIEVVMTFFFLFIIIGTTSKGAAVGLRRHSDRSGADPDPPGVDPGHQHLGQPGAQHRAGAVRRRRIYRSALAVLAGADRSARLSPGCCRAGCTSRYRATCRRRRFTSPRRCRAAPRSRRRKAEAGEHLVAVLAGSGAAVGAGPACRRRLIGLVIVR